MLSTNSRKHRLQYVKGCYALFLGSHWHGCEVHFHEGQVHWRYLNHHEDQPHDGDVDLMTWKISWLKAMLPSVGATQKDKAQQQPLPWHVVLQIPKQLPIWCKTPGKGTEEDLQLISPQYACIRSHRPLLKNKRRGLPWNPLTQGTNQDHSRRQDLWRGR